jgi:hypothetical protein
MRDHVRIVGGLYIDWAAVLAFTLATMSARWFDMGARA